MHSTPEGRGSAGVSSRQRLETEAIVLGYAMSRLDSKYLTFMGASSWKDAFKQASRAIRIPPASLKNLRDEFDPIHHNARKGWRGRPLRPNRQRVADEFVDVSDDALVEFTRRILARDTHATSDAIDVLVPTTRVPAAVAERLLTGRRAEDYFLANCQDLVRHTPAQLTDRRISAAGFDFESRIQSGLVFEVKGIKDVRAAVQFTDREWSEAATRGSTYYLVVVGKLESHPMAKVFVDPHAVLNASCTWRKSISASWQSVVSVAA